MRASKAKFYVGREFWSCSVFEGKVELGLWVVRSIQNRTRQIGQHTFTDRYAYLTKKIEGVTWIKGRWAKKISETFHKTRMRLNVDNIAEWGFGIDMLYTNRQQALRSCLRGREADLKRGENSAEPWSFWRNEEEFTREVKRDIAAIRRMLTREINKQKVSKKSKQT